MRLTRELRNTSNRLRKCTGISTDIIDAALMGDADAIVKYLKGPDVRYHSREITMDFLADTLGILFFTRAHGPLLTATFALAWRGLGKQNWLMQSYMPHDERYLRDLVKTAGTPPPSDWCETITVWRGGCGPDVAQGWSWTTEKSVAAFFSGYPLTHQWSEHRDCPVVLRAEVPRSMIAHHDYSNTEYEVVIPDGVSGAVVDGDPEEWDILNKEHGARVQAANMAMLTERKAAA